MFIDISDEWFVYLFNPEKQLLINIVGNTKNDVTLLYGEYVVNYCASNLYGNPFGLYKLPEAAGTNIVKLGDIIKEAHSNPCKRFTFDRYEPPLIRLQELKSVHLEYEMFYKQNDTGFIQVPSGTYYVDGLKTEIDIRDRKLKTKFTKITFNVNEPVNFNNLLNSLDGG